VHESRRYLGIDLAGAKNQKTALAVLEHYPKENKIFLLDIYERIAQPENHTSDVSLLELIDEMRPGIAKIGVNVPLDLPPCIPCTRKTCPMPERCSVPSVKWMRETTKKAHKIKTDLRVLEFTPYTQRPIELYVRYHVLPRLPESHRFEVDETLGGNRAPLTARMQYLKRHLGKTPLAEVWPKLSIAILAEQLGIHKRLIARYRQLEEGVHSREAILEILTQHHGLFIYERDVRKLSQSLSSFDAFICAYTALLSDTDRCTDMPAGFPASTGWVHFPLIPEAKSGTESR
jgi:hypothetical protein